MRWFNRGVEEGLYYEVVSDGGDCVRIADRQSADEITQRLNYLESRCDDHVNYAVALQKAIDLKCDDRLIPDSLAELIPDYANKMNTHTQELRDDNGGDRIG